MSTPQTPPGLPMPDHDWAWFFDIDGTLTPLASSPDKVRIEPAIQQLISDLRVQTRGAVALISGRSLLDIDRLFPDQRFAAAGQHGVERRHPNGTVERRIVDNKSLATMRTALRIMERRYPGLLLEDKGLSLALHYRQAPDLEALVHREVRSLIQQTGHAFMMQTGKCVVEILPAGNNKGTVVTQFMAEEPFAGRTPVFIGDDATDENAFAAVNALGGHSVKVGKGETQAKHRLDDVAGVKGWLTGSSTLATTHHSGAGDTA